MPPLLTPEFGDNPRARRREFMTETLGAGGAAAFGEAFSINPLPLIAETERLAEEQLPFEHLGAGVDRALEAREQAHVAAGGDPFSEERRIELREQLEARETGLSPVLDPEEANDKYAVGDLKFDRPVREEVARLKAERKREEIARRDIMARSPGGVIGTGFKLGASLLATALDPINVASAFVPVIGEARLAQFTNIFGRSGARISKGAIEGFTGTALVEPLVFTAAQNVGADFTEEDVALDLILGTALGGGLQALTGRLADALDRARPETEAAASRAAIAQAATGRRVDVEPVFDAGRPPERLFHQTTPEAVEGIRERGFIVAEPAHRAGDDIMPDAVFFKTTEESIPLRGGFDRQVEASLVSDARGREFATIDDLESFLKQRDEEYARLLKASRESDRQVAGQFDELNQRIGAARAERRRKDITSERRAELDSEIEALTREFEGIQGRQNEVATAARARATEVLRDLGLDFIRVREDRGPMGRAADTIAVLNPDAVRRVGADGDALRTQRAVQRAAESTADPRNDMTADFDASVRAEELAKDTPDDAQIEQETLLARETVDAMRADGRLTAEMEQAVQDADALVQRAEQYGQAARRAAFCLRRP